MIHLSQLLNQDWYIIIYQTPYFIQISLIFIQCCFSVPKPHPGYHVILTCSLKCNSLLWQFLRSFLIFNDFKVLRSIGQISCGITLSLDCLRLFSWLDWDYGIWGGRPQRAMKCHFYHIIPRIHAISMTYHDWFMIQGDSFTTWLR